MNMTDKELSHDISAAQYDEKAFFLTLQSFDGVIDYIEQRCTQYGCDARNTYRIVTASSEILANIESYAYENGGNIQIRTCVCENTIRIVFIDDGAPFDPFSVQEPEVSAPLSEREPGGLGIYIVRSLMDSVSYRYENGQNVLTIEKSFQADE